MTVTSCSTLIVVGARVTTLVCNWDAVKVCVVVEGLKCKKEEQYWVARP